MVRVLDIWDEAIKIIGNSNRPFAFRRITDSVELLANKGDYDPLVGTVDICVSDRMVTLPPEVEVVLACNVLGQPTMPRGELFQFHLNGPGSCGHAVRYEWTDLADSCTYRELACPGRLYGYCFESEDEQCEFWVEGLDTNLNIIRTQLDDGTWRNGYKVPVWRTQQTAPANAPIFFRITNVIKPITAGPLRLTTVSGEDEVLLGVYNATDTLPRFRRIRLSHCARWVRIHFRRATTNITSRYDLLPLHNGQAVIMMLRALKFYDSPSGLAEAEACEATAVRWLNEEQFTRSPNVVQPLQVSDQGALIDSFDHMT